ncbi:hypothetical protein COCSUDRAFT_57549 [Coccomyxa subellipsoidea C-169]|uniref:Transcription and mRNA export factor ENY2 n=1 Tax=Coccomyxa subellipsoidea (strain C-169) TaxID=574566 RepID=I0YPT2_COCSC|nr:hypothetical protein COCSUDRAFT_57549 [Coccomyxa subellipsoidea C-169]EIE20401.1 hypothetical protein COCSUDRAFT_57549 [Coccomyxa subellipsoidea C-169]|eukprot:XP_005644945.1 hypothetical protein COCSUDRAFT_57549 [Coccomyxa subellipsoidea C-169]
MCHRLKQLLWDRLEECGWRDEVEAHAREIMLAEGNANLAVSDLVKALRPRGRAAVPDDVKAELLAKLRAEIVS